MIVFFVCFVMLDLEFSGVLEKLLDAEVERVQVHCAVFCLQEERDNKDKSDDNVFDDVDGSQGKTPSQNQSQINLTETIYHR